MLCDWVFKYAHWLLLLHFWFTWSFCCVTQSASCPFSVQETQALMKTGVGGNSNFQNKSNRNKHYTDNTTVLLQASNRNIQSYTAHHFSTPIDQSKCSTLQATLTHMHAVLSTHAHTLIEQHQKHLSTQTPKSNYLIRKWLAPPVTQQLFCSNQNLT